MNILQMSISAGLLIIAIVLIRAVALNKLPKTMFLILWGIVLFRLLVPFSIPARFIAAPLPILGNLFTTSDIVVNVLETTEATKQLTEITSEQISNTTPTTVIWFIGMIAMFIFFAVIYFKNRMELRFAILICDNNCLNEWLAKHRLLRSFSIMESDRIKTPIAVGIIKPRIILPKSMSMNDKQLIEYVLTHEYYHIKRYDEFWKILLIISLCVHWFNPLIWIMYVLVNRDLELTCDEMVIRHFGAETKTSYAYSIINMAEQQNKLATLYTGFSKNAAEERIISIMKMKKVSLFGVTSAFILVLMLTVVVLAVSADNTNISANSSEIDLSKDNYLSIERLMKAKQGELENSLTDFDKIDDASVTLIIDSGENTANIILTISEVIDAAETDNIVQFISKSVENLEKDNIKIKDQDSNTIYPVH